MITLNPLKRIFGPAWFAVFFVRNWKNPTLLLTAGYIARLHGPFFKRMMWDEIQTIEGVQWDRAAYDEIFLVFKNAKGRRFVVGELDEGMRALQEALIWRCPGFPAEWKNRVYASGFGNPQMLWEIQQG